MKLPIDFLWAQSLHKSKVTPYDRNVIPAAGAYQDADTFDGGGDSLIQELEPTEETLA